MIGGKQARYFICLDKNAINYDTLQVWKRLQKELSR
jgi:hypothetical protein